MWGNLFCILGLRNIADEIERLNANQNNPTAEEIARAIVQEQERKENEKKNFERIKQEIQKNKNWYDNSSTLTKRYNNSVLNEDIELCTNEERIYNYLCRMEEFEKQGKQFFEYSELVNALCESQHPSYYAFFTNYVFYANYIIRIENEKGKMIYVLADAGRQYIKHYEETI